VNEEDLMMPDAKTTQDDGHWMTADEVAEYLRLPSRRAVYQATRRGAIPYVKLGRLTRFRKKDIDAVLLAHQQNPIDPNVGDLVSDL
jgi:excisionase family DNA binding protein